MDRRYGAYAYRQRTGEERDALAAATQAAYAIAVDQYPGRRAEWEHAASTLARPRSMTGQAKEKGIALGSAGCRTRCWRDARTTAGTARRRTSFIRWRPGSMRSSTNTAVRRKVSCSVPAGPWRNPLRCARRRNFARRRRPPSAAREYTRAFDEVKELSGASKPLAHRGPDAPRDVVEGLRREFAQPAGAPAWSLDEQTRPVEISAPVRACST